MKLFGNSKRKVPQRAPASRHDQSAADLQKAEAGAPKAEAAEQKTEPVVEAQPSNQGRGFLIMAGIALVGVIVMCVLLIRYSGQALIPARYVPQAPSTTAGTETTESEESTEPSEEMQVEELTSTYDSNRINFLIAVVDEDLMTDTLLLAGVDLETGALSYVSVPRDTYVSGNYDVPALNRVYGEAEGGKRGVNALKEKYKEMFGFWVDYYMIVDEEALTQMVDLAGGVEFDVPADLDYSEEPLASGRQTLNGEQAVRLFRFREGYDEVDTSCTQVQRDFIRALLKQTLTSKTAQELDADLEILLPLLDTDLTRGNLNWLAQLLADFDFDSMYHKTLLGEEITVDGRAYYEVDSDDTRNVLNAHFNPTGEDLTEYDLNIRQKTGGAGDGTVPTYYWQNQDSSDSDSDEEPTENDPTEEDSSSEGESTQTPSESEAPTDPPAPSETEAPPEE